MPKRVYPVSHISFSAINMFLNNPWDFKRVYIDKARKTPDKPAMLVGKAVHKALELYYNGLKKEDAIEGALAYMLAGASNVDWGKTGSLDKSVDEFRQTVEHYFLEDPHYEARGTLETEKIMERAVPGIGVPIKAVADLRIPEHRVIVDYKKVTTLTDVENDGIPGKYLMQAVMNYLASEWKPAQILFHEIKTSKNKDGSPQTQIVMVDFTDPKTLEQVKKIKKMVQTILRMISSKTFVFLPNVGDTLNGQDSYLDWIEAS